MKNAREKSSIVGPYDRGTNFGSASLRLRSGADLGESEGVFI